MGCCIPFRRLPQGRLRLRPPPVSLFTEVDDPRWSQARLYGLENILRMATWPSSAVPTMCCRSRATQSQLHEAVAETFAVELAEGFEGCDHDRHKTVNKNYGRIGTRRGWALGTPEYRRYVDSDEA